MKKFLLAAMLLVATSTFGQVQQYNGRDNAFVWSNGAGGYGLFAVTRPDLAAPVTATWTSATSIDTALSMTVSNYTTVTVTVSTTTTITGGSINFEASDDGGTTWYATTPARQDVYTAESTYALIASTKQAWTRNVSAFNTFRVRLNPVLTGTGSAIVRINATASDTTRTVVVGQTDFTKLNTRTTLDNPTRVSCVLTTAATTSTLITGCAAPAAGTAIYVTDVSVYGGVATGATAAATIQSGTGGTCGTATSILYYCQHTATAGCEAHFVIPVRAVTIGEVCILDATVGTKFVVLHGFTAP